MDFRNGTWDTCAISIAFAWPRPVRAEATYDGGRNLFVFVGYVRLGGGVPKLGKSVHHVFVCFGMWARSTAALRTAAPFTNTSGNIDLS